MSHQVVVHHRYFQLLEVIHQLLYLLILVSRLYKQRQKPQLLHLEVTMAENQLAEIQCINLLFFFFSSSCVVHLFHPTNVVCFCMVVCSTLSHSILVYVYLYVCAQ